MRGYPVQKIEQGSKDDRATATKAEAEDLLFAIGQQAKKSQVRKPVDSVTQKIGEVSKHDKETATKAAELFNTSRSCFRLPLRAYAIARELKRGHGQRRANAGRSCEPDNRPARVRNLFA